MSLDARVRKSKQKVLDATFELLEQTGVTSVSVDEIARRSGVAKTTIYRHWPTREALILDASARFIAEQSVPDTGTLEGDLTEILGEIGELLDTARWSSVLPSIVDAAEHDSNYAEVHGQIQRGHSAPLRTVIDRAADRGEIPAGIDRSILVAALLGPLFYRRWFSREPTDRKFVDEIISGVLAGIGVTGPAKLL